MANQIEESEVHRIQRVWAEGIIDIGRAFRQRRDYRNEAENLVGMLYGYQEGPVLFKPTKASQRQFRLEAPGAVSYFVGSDPTYPEDRGFALRPWESVRFENAGLILKEDHALAMGNYYFADESGNEMKVEYTLGFFRAAEGGLKINLHHSSLPFS